MASFLNRAMSYLGLTPDDEDFDGYDDQSMPLEAVESAPAPAAVRPAPAPAARPAPKPAGAPRQTGGRPTPPPAKPRPAEQTRQQRPPQPGTGRPARPKPPEPEAPVVRPVPASVAAAAVPDSGPKQRPAVRAVPAAPKPCAVTPMHFNDVQEIADKFKVNQPVIMNLQHVEKPLARRLLDFSSGICYALGGHMEKVASQVYLITPEHVEVTDEDKRRMQERGLFG